MRKIVIVCGLISGGIVSSLMAINVFMCTNSEDFKRSEVVGYATMIIAFSLIFVGIKMFRDKYNGGVVSFGKAFLVGLYIALIASTVYVLVWAVEYKYFYPDFLEKYAAHMIKDVKASGASKEKMDATLTQMKMFRDWYKNPFLFTLLTYVEILPVGLAVSLISALILRRKNTSAPVMMG